MAHYVRLVTNLDSRLCPVDSTHRSLLARLGLSKHDKTIMRKWTRLVVSFGILSSATACSEIETGPNISGVDVMSISAVRIEPGVDTIYVGDIVGPSDVVRLKGVAIGRSGAPLTVSKFVWQSSDESVAVVDSSGLVRAVREGSTEISASAYRVGRATIFVMPEVAKVAITALASQPTIGDTVQLLARAFTWNDSILPRKFAWSSSNPAVGSVDSTGRFVAKSSGNTVVIASAGGKSSSIRIDVVAQELFAVEAGGDFACGIATGGVGYCWGDGETAQLGSVADSLCRGDLFAQADRRCAIAPKRLARPDLAFTAISAGENFGCAIAAQLLYCWGDGFYGQLGDGRVSERSTPQLATVGTEKFVSLSAGAFHACALNLTGAAFCWGKDSTGQLGDNRRVHSTTPIPVVGTDGLAANALRFIAISAGRHHTCAIQTQGRAYCWGDGVRGALGTASRASNDVPSSVSSTESYSSIASGSSHTCGVTNGGALYCWGSNDFGQLGLGASGTDQLSPVLVGSGYTTVTAGDNFTCALTSSHAVHCFGSNAFGQLGRGEGNPSGIGDTPKTIVSGLTFNSITAGRRHACAVAISGGTWCWGSNIYGALGNSHQAAIRSVPERVAQLR